MSALPPKADIGTQPRDVRFVPKADIRSSIRLFDDLVRLGGEIRRHLDAERLGGPEIDDELKFGRLHHWQVSGLLAPQNPPSVNASMGVAIADACAVAHQAARQRVFTLLVDGRN